MTELDISIEALRWSVLIFLLFPLWLCYVGMLLSVMLFMDEVPPVNYSLIFPVGTIIAVMIFLTIFKRSLIAAGYTAPTLWGLIP